MPPNPDPKCLPPDREKAVETWLSQPVGTCRFCGQPIYPTDLRPLRIPLWPDARSRHGPRPHDI